MKPAAFDYIRADTIDEVVQLLSQYGEDARILAGGQSLIVALNMRLTQPRVLIDISRVEALSGIKLTGTTMTVGAAVTQVAVERVVRDNNNFPLLAQAFPHLGHFQTRNRGTVCGSIAHADPSAEFLSPQRQGLGVAMQFGDLLSDIVTHARSPRANFSRACSPLPGTLTK